MSLQEALADGTELFEVLFQRSALSVAVLDRDLILRKFNQAFAESVRRNGAPEAGPARVGRSLHVYFPAHKPATWEMFRPVFAGETRWHRGSPHEVDGQLTYWDILLSPLRRDGQIVGVVEMFTDATERTVAQQQVQRNERRFRAILRHSSDLVLIVDPDSTIRYAAPSAGTLLGVPLETLCGGRLAGVLHPEDVGAVHEALVRCTSAAPLAPPLSDGSFFRCRMRHPDGLWHTFEVIPVNLLDDPDVHGIVLTARDVTERERAEAELRRRDAVLEAVRIATQRFLESQSSWRANINEVMALLGRASAVSRVYIFENYRDSEGSLWANLSHEWAAPGVRAQVDDPGLGSFNYDHAGLTDVARVLGSGEVLTEVHSLVPEHRRARLGRYDAVSMVLVPVFVSGTWWGVLGFDDRDRERKWSATEIDALRAAASTLSAAVQRQRAEDELREQQAQYRQVFDATSDGLVITDLDSRLVRANPAFYRMHGYRPGELLGQRSSTWLHPDFQRVRGNYTDSVLRGERPHIQAVDVRKDGSTFPVQIHGSAFAFQGRPHVLGVVRDDTERSQAFGLLEKRVSALSEVAASLTVNQRLPDTMDVVAHSVVSATPAIACSVYVTDALTGELRVTADAGLPDGYADAIEQCWYQRVSHSSWSHTAPEPRVFTDVPRKILEMPEAAPLHPFARDAEWDTVVTVALGLQGRDLGTLNAYYPKGIEPSPDDLAFLRAVADQGTVAVENARLLAEAQSKAGLEERQRLARDLHDSVSQALYGIALGARTAKALAGQEDNPLREPLDYILSLAKAGMTEMRSLIFELRPESLANEGLVAALERRLDVLRTRHQLLVRASLCGEPRLPLPLKETLYRIAQEALHNTVRHSRADQVELRLDAVGDGHIELVIADDGVGFDPADLPPGHLGMQSMRERAGTHGGTFELRTAPREGTVVRVRLPVPGEAPGSGQWT